MISSALFGVIFRLLSAKTNPSASAPYSQARFAVSISVMPQIFTFIYSPYNLQKRYE
ncbi:hypothetical protein protein [Bacillus cereus G9241]|nr:hypothetical protein protein [Bacillus cereus G9241]